MWVQAGINAEQCGLIGTTPKQETSPYLNFVELIVRQFDYVFRSGARQLRWRLIMSRIATVNELKTKAIRAILVTTVPMVVVGSLAFAAQDKYTLKIPDGLAWSDFRGYETWQGVAVSQTETSLKVIAANDVMINAYGDGVPGNGQAFPDGSKITKIEWSFKKNSVSPYFVNVPDTLKTVAFIEKDTKRFPDTHGWAYAQWAYDAATETFKPSELSPSGSECGFACHTKVSSQDYIFTAYPKR